MSFNMCVSLEHINYIYHSQITLYEKVYVLPIVAVNTRTVLAIAIANYTY